jgi:hypothetical protein
MLTFFITISKSVHGILSASRPVVLSDKRKLELRNEICCQVSNKSN